MWKIFRFISDLIWDFFAVSGCVAWGYYLYMKYFTHNLMLIIP